MSTRDDVLAALREAGECGVSGEALAGELGISRVAVGKHVAALREVGYVIDAEPGVGYRLRSAPDLPLPAEVAWRVGAAGWMRLTGGGETGSTSDDARALAREGTPGGTVVLASSQSSGRGRLGRSWLSPTGGLYLSLVLKPEVAPSELPSLSLAIGLGIVRGLEGCFGVRPTLKWPNDVQLAGGKLAGILLEMAAEADRVNWVVVGVGVNVRTVPELDGVPAACLDDVVPGVLIAEVAAAVLDGIAETYAIWTECGFAALASEYEARSSLTGHAVSVWDMSGAMKAAGTVMGVDEAGRLLVATLAGVEAIVAGEVTLHAPEEPTGAVG